MDQGKDQENKEEKYYGKELIKHQKEEIVKKNSEKI